MPEHGPAFGFAPAEIARDAAVCLKSFGVIVGNSAVVAWCPTNTCCGPRECGRWGIGTVGR
jgi:hypothetical protein